MNQAQRDARDGRRQVEHLVGQCCHPRHFAKLPKRLRREVMFVGGWWVRYIMSDIRRARAAAVARVAKINGTYLTPRIVL